MAPVPRPTVSSAHDRPDAGRRGGMYAVNGFLETVREQNPFGPELGSTRHRRDKKTIANKFLSWLPGGQNLQVGYTPKNPLRSHPLHAFFSARLLRFRVLRPTFILDLFTFIPVQCTLPFYSLYNTHPGNTRSAILLSGGAQWLRPSLPGSSHPIVILLYLIDLFYDIL